MRSWQYVALLVTFQLAVGGGCSPSPSPGAGAGTSGGRGGGGGQAAAGSGGIGGRGGEGGSRQGGSAGSAGAGGSGGAAGSSATGGSAGLPDASGGSGGSAGSGGLGGSAVDGGVDSGGSAGDMGGGAANPANVIWYADPARGNAAFKNVETEGGCTVSVIDDPEHGKVRKFNRPPGTNRCEAKGAVGYNTKEGDLVYVGMRYKLEAPMNLTVTGIFQWKTYDTPGRPNTLNFPVLVRPSAGRLNVEVRRPATAQGGGGISGGSVIWSIPTPIGQWFTIVLGIKQSYDPKVGWVEVYYNGQQQKLSDGSMRVSCQTLDGGFIDPKWGIYGTNSSPKPQSASFVGDIRIARDYPSAAPESY